MTTEQSTVPPPNTTLYRGHRRDESDGRASHREGTVTVLAAARPFLHGHRSKHEAPLPAAAGASHRLPGRPVPKVLPASPERRDTSVSTYRSGRALGKFHANPRARC